MRQKAIRSKQGIVWNALERSGLKFFPAKAVAGRGRGKSRAQAGRALVGMDQWVQELTSLPGKNAVSTLLSTSELIILDEQVGAGKAVRNGIMRLRGILTD